MSHVLFRSCQNSNTCTYFKYNISIGSCRRGHLMNVIYRKCLLLSRVKLDNGECFDIPLPATTISFLLL